MSVSTADGSIERLFELPNCGAGVWTAREASCLVPGD
jgi:hypothetical protein